MDTSFSYSSDKAFFSSDEAKWIHRIEKMAEQYPDKIKILQRPTTNDGCIYVELPPSWLKIMPKRTVDLSDEERAKLSERLRGARQKRTGKTVKI